MTNIIQASFVIIDPSAFHSSFLTSILGGLLGIFIGYQSLIFFYDNNFHWNPKHWVRLTTATYVITANLSKDDVMQWCRENSRGNYLVTDRCVFFNRKSDAVLFKIFHGV